MKSIEKFFVTLAASIKYFFTGKGTTKVVLLGSMIFLALVMSLLYLGRGILVSGDDAAQAATAQGYSNVVVVDKAVFFVSLRGCGQDDAVRFLLTATNSQNTTVRLTVCAGWPFKAFTVRTQ